MDTAVGLAAEILREREHDVASLEMIPSRGGVFEVTVDGELVFSKKALGRHARAGEVMDAIRTRRA